jgi:hypothetical protein
MSVPVTKPEDKSKPADFDELDKVKLTKTITAKGKTFPPGLEGIIGYCHGTEAYEVEFPGIHHFFFQVPFGSLEKLRG